MKHAGLVLLLVGCFWTSCASAKRLLTFGDSITDNGNGTNSFVQAYFSQLLGQNVTAVSTAPHHSHIYASLQGLITNVDTCPSFVSYNGAHAESACLEFRIGNIPAESASTCKWYAQPGIADLPFWHGRHILQAPSSSMAGGPMDLSGQVLPHK